MLDLFRVSTVAPSPVPPPEGTAGGGGGPHPSRLFVPGFAVFAVFRCSGVVGVESVWVGVVALVGVGECGDVVVDLKRMKMKMKKRIGGGVGVGVVGDVGDVGDDGHVGSGVAVKVSVVVGRM